MIVSTCETHVRTERPQRVPGGQRAANHCYKCIKGIRLTYHALIFGQIRIYDPDYCLDLANRNITEFFRRYVTMDERRLHKFTSEYSQQSHECTGYAEFNSIHVKTQHLADKVMAPIVWDVHFNYLPSIQQEKN